MKDVVIVKIGKEKQKRIVDSFNSKIIKNRKIDKAYSELLMAVENKYPGETRHETALRYIKDAESSKNEGASVKNEDISTEL